MTFQADGAINPSGGVMPFLAMPLILVPEMNSKSSFLLGSKKSIADLTLLYAATLNGTISSWVRPGAIVSTYVRRTVTTLNIDHTNFNNNKKGNDNNNIAIILIRIEYASLMVIQHR